jgi:hypothetical protein
MRPDRPPGGRARERPPVTTPRGHSPKHSTTADEVSIRLHGTAGAAGELAAWGAAVAHLHQAGLPAAVPPFPAAWLARRGVKADWVAAA